MGSRLFAIDHAFAAFLGFFLWLVFNGFLFLLTRWAKKTYLANSLFLINHLLIVAFLLFFHFFLGAAEWVSNQTLFNLFSLSLYFFSLKTMEQALYPEHKFAYSRFLLPFCIPFLASSILFDGLSLIGLSEIEQAAAKNPAIYLFMIAGMLIFAFLILLFLSPFLILLWGCSPLEPSLKKEGLEAFCKRVGFSHGGFKVWNLFNQSFTAGIIGILPPFRYILFTRPILKLPLDTLIAILAHEIGHASRRHLLLYPLILCLLIFLSMQLSYISLEPLQHYFSLQNLMAPSPLWKVLFSLALFLPNLFLMIGYLRFVFGFFSRLFERQADLHCFEVGVNPFHMIDALDKVAVHSRTPHSTPSWHHFSIEKRILFLLQCIEDKRKVAFHHFKVKLCLTLHFLFTFCFGAYVFFSLFYQEYHQEDLHNFNLSLQRNIQNFLSSSLETKSARIFSNKYQLQGNQEIIQKALEKAFSTYGGARFSGIAEFYAAQSLFQSQEEHASFQLMILAWEHFELSGADNEIKEAFKSFSIKLLNRKDKVPQPLSAQLEHFLNSSE